MSSQKFSLKWKIITNVWFTFSVVYVVLAVVGYQLASQQANRQQEQTLLTQIQEAKMFLENGDYNLQDDSLAALLAPDTNTRVTFSGYLEEGLPLETVNLKENTYVVVTQLPSYRLYLRLDQAKTGVGHLVAPLFVVWLVLVLLIGFILLESLKREFRIFSRINQVFATVIKQPSLKTLPFNGVIYTETEELVSNLNDMLAIVDDQNLKQLRFISDVSHELRTPVSVIKGYMSMLLRWGKEDPVVLNESLQASLKETSRMEIMIKDMLDMIRIQGSFEDHQDDVTEVDDSLDTVLSNFKLLYSDVVFNTKMDDFLPLAKIYQVHFEQVLVILIDNAIKYSPAKKEIDVTVVAADNGLKLSVRDRGQGISDEDIKHIFDRFFRSSESRNRQETSAGVGIGLSLLKQITDAYGIAVDVESVINQGTTFTLLIPVADLSDSDSTTVWDMD